MLASSINHWSSISDNKREPAHFNQSAEGWLQRNLKSPIDLYWINLYALSLQWKVNNQILVYMDSIVKAINIIPPPPGIAFVLVCFSMMQGYSSKYTVINTNDKRTSGRTLISFVLLRRLRERIFQHKVCWTHCLIITQHILSDPILIACNRKISTTFLRRSKAEIGATSERLQFINIVSESNFIHRRRCIL